MNINTVHVLGNLTKSPESKVLPSGQTVCNLSIATNHVWTADGEKKESTEFHNIVVFGKQAENTAKYLTKGSSAYVEGRLQTRSWEADGQKHYRTEIIADRIQFGPRKDSKVADTSVDYPEPSVEDSVPF